MFTIVMHKRNRTEAHSSQSGVVSLIVVSILTVVIALVALGFSKLMDREVRQSLDNELSAQAYYSAQAGLNDARAYLADCQTSSPNPNCGFSDCNSWPSLGNSYFVSDLSGGSKLAKYSCVTIATNPNELIYTINAGQSVTFSVNIPQMAKMYIGWEKTSYQNGPQPLGAFTSLPQQSGLPTDATGLLRVGLYPAPNSVGSTTTNANLTAASRTYFLYPDAGTAAGQLGTVDYSTNGNFVHGYCHTNNTNPINNPEAAARYCNSVITGLNGYANSNNFYVHLTAQYTPLIVTIQATNKNGAGGSANPLQFNNTQAVVDVTGQGTDVLQRIRARIDLNNAFQTPDFGIQSMVAICKGYEVEMQSQGAYGAPTVDTPNGDNACATPSPGGTVSTSPSDLSPHQGLPGPAPPPSASVNMVSIRHDYNNAKGNGELWLTGTVNDAGASGTTAWFDSVTCDPSGTGFGAFPTAKQSIPADSNNHTISAYVFPWTFYYCGYHPTMSFVICANIPSVGKSCSSAMATSPPL